MAANGMRRALQVSSSSAKILFGRSSAASSSSKIGKSAGIAFGNGSSSSSSSSSRPSLRRLTFSRVPVELSAGVSLVPLHSVTASALLTSLLSLSNQNWSCLSEGFASTL
ncbi:PREDICTED: protein NUCLEAR FUSION DEFECTIVE 6, chloroplastic/mitochondrial isoform X2 [Camelina sativa]|uniref:Protein NUCLEAR FUSION DEFECTIVE 6, chloroplastic/mitochondrial isoform X2 n=1 Tax=Camelina sativa TaxID=90675 RepID=A0ABM0TKN8_CAMSA|nr:PREDICTED: protein NUCLEAR FUSION DEFECTIVE 6, chloroplastic/mitochondrial isoform X2 [Camelina sativa]